MSSTQEVGDIFGTGQGSAQAMLRSPTVLILCVGLWGMNIFFYRLFGIDYTYVFNYDLLEISKEEKEKDRAEHSKQRRILLQRSHSDYDIEMMKPVVSDALTDTTKTTTTTSTADGSTRTRSPHPPPARQLTSFTRSVSSSFDHNSNSNSNNTETVSAPGMLQTPPTSLSFVSPNEILKHQSVQTTLDLFPSLGSSSSSSSSGASIVWYKLVLFSVIMVILLHVSTHYWIDHLHRATIGAVGFFYAILFLYIFIPIQQNTWLRRSLYIVIQRTWALFHPRCFLCRLLRRRRMGGPSPSSTVVAPRRIPFIDVFYADAMCSLSKVFFDWGMLTHQALHYPHPVPAAMHNIIVPSLCAAVPYVCRARQCWIMYTVGRIQGDSQRYQHVANALKYSTSLFPLVLSAYIKTHTAQEINTSVLEIVLTLLLIINASYSLYWDIVMDWGMMQDPYKVAQTACQLGLVPSSTLSAAASTRLASSSSSAVMPSEKGDKHNRYMVVGESEPSPPQHRPRPCQHVCLRPRLRFGFTLSALIVVADAFLRFCWLLKFVPNLFPSTDAFVLTTQFLEVFRRAIWNLLRVEWENMKQQKSKLAAASTPPSLLTTSFSSHDHRNSSSISMSTNSHGNNSSIPGLHDPNHDGKCPDSLSDNSGDHDDDEDDYLQDENHSGRGGGGIFEMKSLVTTIT